MTPKQARELAVGDRVVWIGDFERFKGVVAEAVLYGKYIEWENGKLSFYTFYDLEYMERENACESL